MSTPGRPALRAVATLIDSGLETRAQIVDAAKLNRRTTMYAINRLIEMGWISNTAPKGKPAQFRLVRPLADIERDCGEAPIRQAWTIDPLLEAWPLPVEARA